jgi:predicted GIY-YIG superfamily endonuclease
MTVLYRLFDSEDRLLYVGITDRYGLRMGQHRTSKWWWPRVHRTETEWFASRAVAETMEVRAIRSERPLYNVMDTERALQSAAGLVGAWLTLDDPYAEEREQVAREALVGAEGEEGLRDLLP